MILLQTAEVHVVKETNNREIKLKVLFNSASEKSFFVTTCLHLFAAVENLYRKFENKHLRK